MNRKVCLILGLHETSLLPDTYGTPALLLSQETSWVLIHVWLTISREPCSQTWEHGGRLPILYTTCAIIRRASGVGGRALPLPVARPRTSVARSHPITSQINLRTCLTLLCYRPWELYLLSLSLSLHYSVMLLSTPTRFVVRSNVFRWFIVVCPHFT